MSLTPYSRPVVRKRYTVYDLEWYPGTYVLRIVGVYDRERGYRSYSSIDAFLDAEMTAENRGRIFYAHAGGLADIQFVLESLLMRRTHYEVAASFSGSSAIIFQVAEKKANPRDKGGKPWIFCDSFWLMRDSLDNIAQSIRGKGKGKKKFICPDFPHCGHHEGIPYEKTKDGDERALNTCVFYAPESVLREYNAEDCKILYEAIERLEDELIDLGGELMMTIASCALRLFRRAFLKREISASPEVNLLASESYVASRVEVWERKAPPPVFSYDINSSFPYSLTLPQPGNCLGKRRWVEKDELGLVFAEVHVPEDVAVPPLPKRVNGRVFFPVGQWKGWFTGIDLQFLLSQGGHILQVWDAYGFESFDDTRAYVETLYALRLKAKAEGDEFRALVIKYLLNSLYGKFAEGSEKDQLLLRKPVPKGATIQKSLLGGHALFCLRKVKVPHAIVHISNVTTARSRRLLGEGAIRIGNPKYMDTDSILSKRKPWELDPVNGVRTSSRLGDFKWERDKFVSEEETDYEGLAAKLYRLGGSVKAKGFSRIKGQRAKREHFDLLSGGHPLEIRRMTRVKEVLTEADAHMRLDEPVDFMPHDVDILKQAVLTDRPKREWLPDGSTQPWHVSRLEEPYFDEARAEEVVEKRRAHLRGKVVAA